MIACNIYYLNFSIYNERRNCMDDFLIALKEHCLMYTLKN